MKTLLFIATMIAAILFASWRNPSAHGKSVTIAINNKLNADKNKMYARNVVSHTTVGMIYSKSSWTNTDDFITNGNSVATLSGSYVNVSSATQDNWNNVVHITNYATKLEKWKFKLRFRLVAWAGNSYGLGIGLKSANENIQNDVMGFLQTTNSGSGGLYIVKSGRTTMAAGITPLNYNLNDDIELEVQFHDSVFHFIARNINTGASATVSYTYASNGSTYAVPNTSYFSLMELGGTHQVQNIEISSEEIAGSNIVVVGDSKTIGYFANTFSGRYARQLNNNYADVVINAGGADRVTHVLKRKDELLRLDGNKYLLCLGSNDFRFGSTLAELQANYDSLVQILQASGAAVYHFLLPEDYTKPLGVNQLDFRNWLTSTYPANYINVWDSMASGNFLKSIFDTGDGVHLNQAANDKIYEALVASNKLGGGITLPVKLLSFSADPAGSHVNLKWKADLNFQAWSYYLERSADGLRYDQLTEFSQSVSGNYLFADQNPYQGANFYRLKMKEDNGGISYSKVIKVIIAKPQLLISGHERISQSNYYFKVVSPRETVLELLIFDAAGKVVYKSAQSCTKGYNKIPLSLGNVAPGIYHLRVSGKTEGYRNYKFLH